MANVRVKVLPSSRKGVEGSRKVDSFRGVLNLYEGSENGEAHNVFCASFEAPIGIIYIASTGRGLCKIALPKDGKASFFSWINENFTPEEIVDDRKKNLSAIRQLNEYFIGKRSRFDLDVDLIGTPFQHRVWTELAKIPYGTTVTYKQVARRVHTIGFRAVGATVSKNPLPIVVPCHRVVGSDYKLVGYGGGIKLKEYLLRLEGIILI